jgi:hypothetical protein
MFVVDMFTLLVGLAWKFCLTAEKILVNFWSWSCFWVFIFVV